jgi:hypothetical protein
MHESPSDERRHLGFEWRTAVMVNIGLTLVPCFLAVADGLSDFSDSPKTHPQVSKISISLVFNNLKF